MSHVFTQDDADRLLHNKFIVIIGDSVQRGVYKDLVMLLNRNRYLTQRNLRSKGEATFEGDELIEGGIRSKMTNGINYREVRQYNSKDHLIRFYFVTRCYNNYIESILLDLKKEPKPDVVMMNSCLWDITRYGRNAIDEYKENLQKTIRRFKESLPESCIFIWNCTLPISRNARGGFLIPEVEFRNGTLRLDIIEANYYAREIVASHNFDVLDLHYHLRTQLNRRTPDGIHWDNTAHRRITNLILTHISKVWNYDLSTLQKSEEALVNFKGSSNHHHTRSRSYDNRHQNSNPIPYSFNSNSRSRHSRSHTIDSGYDHYGKSGHGYDYNDYKIGYGYYGYSHSDTGYSRNSNDSSSSYSYPHQESYYNYKSKSFGNENCRGNKSGSNIGPIRSTSRNNHHPYNSFNRPSY